MVEACNSVDCTGSSEVNAMNKSHKAIGYFNASNPDEGDEFGNAVALSENGNMLAVAAFKEDSNATGINGNQDDNSATDPGAVYLYRYDGKAWGQEAYFKASNTGSGDSFGRSVAISADGNTLAVGALLEDSRASGINGDQNDNTSRASGAVYVFRYSGTQWLQQAYIKASIAGAGDIFGRVVALSRDGNTLAVGASQEASNAVGINGDQSDNSMSLSGAVYLFRFDGMAWEQEAYIKSSNTGLRDTFGQTIAMNWEGDTLAVGAWSEDSNATGINGNQDDDSTPDAGAVYMFHFDGSDWSQQAYIKASNTEPSDSFGQKVAVCGEGDTLAVAAISEDSNATGINGNQNDNSSPDAGAVYLYRFDGTAWDQEAYIKASNTDAGDLFGWSVALNEDGNTLAVGAGEGGNATGIKGDQNSNSANRSGAVYVFRFKGSKWSQKTYVKASNTDIRDLFSAAVALSADGKTLAVGAMREDSSVAGINGDQGDNSVEDTGAVYLY
jgi:hypothetical protein